MAEERKRMNPIKRKLVTTVLTASAVPLYVGVQEVINQSMGNGAYTENPVDFLMIFTYYIGLIIFLYGNMVSLLLEHIQRKWFSENNWLYVLLHGLFGLVNGVMFLHWAFALAGMAFALLYAVIDRWLYAVVSKWKRPYLILALPAGVFAGSLLVMQNAPQPEVPPFTGEAAIEQAVNRVGAGTALAFFPSRQTSWNGVINGYAVTRSSNAKQAGPEVYTVTFRETWEKAVKTGEWTLGYLASRDTLSNRQESGEIPPYYGEGLTEEELKSTVE